MEYFKPELENMDIIRKYLRYNRYRGCDLCAANSVLWGEYYKTYFTVIRDTITFCRLKDGRAVNFTFPMGKENIREAFDDLLAYFKENDLPVVFTNINEEMEQIIEGWYPGRFETVYDRDYADYIYKAEKLADLKGKKLHGKRNHINRFIENYPDYEFSLIDDSNRESCMQLAKDWNQQKEGILEEDKDYEERALDFALTHMEKMGLVGGVLKVNGDVIAFTIGEPLTEDTFVVHFEKAYAEIQGAYPMINREFVRNCMQNFTYVNREEDLGLEGLRKAKLSYYPDILYRKGVMRER